MTNPNDPASILQIHGLTKREYFAALALKGLLATEKHITNYGVNLDSEIHDTPRAHATVAIAMADALIAELSK